MNRDQETIGRIQFSILVGLWIVGFVCLTPDAGDRHVLAVLHVARHSPWSQPLDWPAAWCSVKILLACVACFLILDSLGTLLIKLKRHTLAHCCFYSIVLPCLGFFVAGYYLLKALL